MTLAIQALTEDGQGALLVDDRSETNVDHVVVGEITVADMGGRQLAVATQFVQGRDRAGSGAGVGPVEDQVGGVEMQVLQGQAGQSQGLGRAAGENGVALLEEGVKGTAEAVVVKLVGGQVPEDVSSCAFRPVGKV